MELPLITTPRTAMPPEQHLRQIGHFRRRAKTASTILRARQPDPLARPEDSATVLPAAANCGCRLGAVADTGGKCRATKAARKSMRPFYRSNTMPALGRIGNVVSSVRND